MISINVWHHVLHRVRFSLWNAARGTADQHNTCRNRTHKNLSDTTVRVTHGYLKR
jgi:hypothetical protein